MLSRISMKGLFTLSRIPPMTKSTLEKNSQNSKQQNHRSKEGKTKDEDTKKATGKHIGEVLTYSKKMLQNSEKTSSPGKLYTSVNLEV